MAFPQYETLPLVANATASNSLTVDLPASVSAGNLLLVIISTFDSTRATAPTGWERTAYHDNDPGCGINFLTRVADGTEGGTQITVPLDKTVTTVVQVTQVAQWEGTISGGLAISTPNIATSGTADPSALTPAWGAADTLWMVYCTAGDDAGTITGFPANYTDQISTVADAGANASCTHATATRNRNATTEDPGTFSISESEYWLAGVAAIQPGASGSLSTAPQEVRKSSTFDIETTLSGTVTNATLNGNAITVDIQTGTTVTLTDSDGSITTSGEYDLVLTDDAAATETIAVQVNVVGLPTNTAKKDGGLLTSLADLTLDAVNSSGTVVEQLTGITTDASGIISAIDLSHISEAIGDTLKVSLHSAAADVGVTFEQALEAI